MSRTASHSLERSVRLLATAALLAGAFALGGCSLTTDAGLPAIAMPGPALAAAAPAEPVVVLGEPPAPETAPVDPSDDLTLGKRHFAEMNYGLAEQHFRRAIEASTGSTARDTEAWIGLAASYDRLRRFDLADRAYGKAIRLWGAAPEILNNQGYSYLLRGDYRTARATLLAASAKDPDNPWIRNNLVLLEKSRTRGTAIR
jgi:tetratricopeptide (TPR) repeat protein